MESSSLLVWGSGGHGRVVADLVRVCGYRLAGYVDADPARVGQAVETGGRVVVSEADFLAAVQGARAWGGAAGVALGIGDGAARAAALRSIPGLAAPALVHPSAVVSPSARLGRGTVVLPLAVVHVAAVLGDAVIVNSGAIVEHDCVLDEGVHVSPGASLAGAVRVGAGSWIGAGAVVIQGVKVGRGATVGAGTVVIRDVPDGVTVVGNPARVIRSSRERPA